MFDFLLITMIILSIIYALSSNNTSALSSAAINGAQRAIDLCINLGGTMALWGGIMRVAQRCKLTEKVSSVVKIPLSRLFKSLKDEKTLELISLNVTANLLGLGNAATPFGIKAMKRLSGTDGTDGVNCALFVLLNTASVQLIPLTVSTIRLSYGAENPLDIAPAVIFASFASLTVGIITAKIIYKVDNKP